MDDNTKNIIKLFIGAILITLALYWFYEVNKPTGFTYQWTEDDYKEYMERGNNG